MSENGRTLSLDVPVEWIEAAAERAAEIVSERIERPDPWLDMAGAAEHLSCKESRIYALTSANRIPVHRDGSRLLFRRSELDEWVEAGGARRP